MTRRTLVFELLSYWQAGSGRGAAALADSVVARDADDLPFLPGRTVKGLLRDAMDLAAEAGAVPRAHVERWFGSPIAGSPKASGDEKEQALEAGRHASEPGALWFGSASLPESWRRWSRAPRDGADVKREDVLRELTRFVASTAIDGDGVALEHSLRVAEVAVPMTLRAEIRGPEDDGVWVDDLRAALPLLRCLGSRRQRGYGRVRVTLEEP